MTRRKGSKDYPEWMKREVIKLYTEGGEKRVSAWARQYRVEGEAMFAAKRSRSGRKPKRGNTVAYIARLEMELDLLKKFHTELRQGSLAKRNIGSSNTTAEDTK